MLSITSLGLGFILGSRGVTHNEQPTPVKGEDAVPTITEEEEHDEEDEEHITDGDLSAISAGFMEPCKLVRIPRFPFLQ